MTPLSPRGPALHLRGLSLQLGGTQILEALDWQVAPGQVHALVGPNGCGKSSLLKSILGLCHTVAKSACTGREVGQVRWATFRSRSNATAACR